MQSGRYIHVHQYIHVHVHQLCHRAGADQTRRYLYYTHVYQ